MVSAAIRGGHHKRAAMFDHYKEVVVLAVFIKALVMGMLATFVDAPFVKSLILVAVSALMTGAFAVLVVVLQIRADRKVHTRIDRIEERQIVVAKQMGTDPDLPADQAPNVGNSGNQV